jgi:hypothetical protein
VDGTLFISRSEQPRFDPGLVKRKALTPANDFYFTLQALALRFRIVPKHPRLVCNTDAVEEVCVGLTGPVEIPRCDAVLLLICEILWYKLRVGLPDLFHR